jgi:2-oxoglutarate/2-oxoacid ferredoxin oxidoreductase subunit alpha
MKRARTLLPESEVDYDANKSVGIISFGSNDPAVQEARDRLAADDIATNYLRIRALPLRREVIDFVHQSRAGLRGREQLRWSDGPASPDGHPEDSRHVISLPLGDGLPMTPRFVHESILREERK